MQAMWVSKQATWVSKLDWSDCTRDSWGCSWEKLARILHQQQPQS